jgi:Arc/MetJ family transcription regulator
MRTTLDLPEGLVEEARDAIGFKSKTDTVVFALKEIVRRKRKDELKDWLTKWEWTFDPTEIRKREREKLDRR